MPLCTVTFVLFTEADSYTMHTKSGVTHDNLEENIWNFLYFHGIFYCVYLVLLCFLVPYCLCDTILLNVNIPSKPCYCKRSSSRNLVCLQWFLPTWEFLMIIWITLCSWHPRLGIVVPGSVKNHTASKYILLI